MTFLIDDHNNQSQYLVFDCWDSADWFAYLLGWKVVGVLVEVIELGG